MPVLDYSNYVEVVAREADATAYGYFASDADLAKLSPRLTDAFAAERHSMPPSWIESTSLHLPPRQDRIAQLARARVALFNRIEEMSTPVNEWSIRRELVRWFGSHCYVCGAETRVARKEQEADSYRTVAVRACHICGWWESENFAYLATAPEPSRHYDSYTLLRRAVLREFAIVDDEAPLTAIRSHLSRHASDIHHLSPRGLEMLVGDVFEDFFDCEAIHIGGPGDGGIDLLLLHGDSNAVVQVKQHRNPNHRESVSTIREFIGAMMLDGQELGLIVTTGLFSRPSRDAARDAGEIAVERLKLIDGQRLLDILKAVSDQAEPALRYGPRLEDEVPAFQTFGEALLRLDRQIDLADTG